MVRAAGGVVIWLPERTVVAVACQGQHCTHVHTCICHGCSTISYTSTCAAQQKTVKKSSPWSTVLSISLMSSTVCARRRGDVCHPKLPQRTCTQSSGHEHMHCMMSKYDCHRVTLSGRTCTQQQIARAKRTGHGQVMTDANAARYCRISSLVRSSMQRRS
jgi:hypothetical protein